MDFSGIEDDVKQKPYLLLIPVGMLAYVLVMRKKSGNVTTTNSAPGSLSTAGQSLGVDASALQSAMQTLSGQEQKDIQGINTSIAGVQQQIAQNAAQTTAAIGQSSQQFANQINQIKSSMNQAAVTSIGTQSLSSPHPTTSALSARQQLGDSAIVSYFSQFKLPSWIGLQYVAENAKLPASVTDLQSWLNSKGYRDPNSGAFTPIVSSSVVPTNVQSELTSAFGG